jgi:fucose 4-O-acetylase-like acetyltransferase
MPEAPQPPVDAPVPRVRRQDRSIQALRGLAVVLMVAGHVIGPDADHGLRFGEDSGWHYFYMALADIRMPLFTLISGYVYAMVPVGVWGEYPMLMRAKARRLLIPLITVTTLTYLVKRVAPDLNSDVHHTAIWRVYAFGFEHLWFLQAIFLIFLIVGILDAFGMLATRTRWIGVMAVSAVVFVVIEVPDDLNFFSLNGTFLLLPFFLLGYGLRRHKALDLRGPAFAATAVAFAAIYSVRLLTIFGVYHPHEYMGRMIAFAVGGTGVVLIYSIRRLIDTKALAWIGGFSFGIYLLHVFAAAGTRVVLERSGIHLGWALFVIGLVMGVAVPIVFQLVFRNVPLVQTVVLGERWAPKRRKSASPAVAEPPLNRADPVKPAEPEGDFVGN